MTVLSRERRANDETNSDDTDYAGADANQTWDGSDDKHEVFGGIAFVFRFGNGMLRLDGGADCERLFAAMDDQVFAVFCATAAENRRAQLFVIGEFADIYGPCGCAK